MTDKQHPAQFDWATELSDAQGRVTLSAQEAKEIGARLRSMGEKLKAYEDLGDAGSDVQLLRMGYAAAQAAPAAMHSDLRARCVEVLAWRETGTLPGEALRTLAREKYGDRYDAIQRAERDTETEALNFVAAAPTTQPAPQQDAQEGKK